tara:strand:+ start:321 stop:605 length:285 start_codon:yes stop_codon:yes gene_type:complete
MTNRIDAGAAIKVALWAVPVLFGFGAMYQSLAGSSAQVAEVAAGLEQHEDLHAHPVTEERINTILTEQRALREDVADQAVALGAICQATGAICR